MNLDHYGLTVKRQTKRYTDMIWVKELHLLSGRSYDTNGFLENILIQRQIQSMPDLNITSLVLMSNMEQMEVSLRNQTKILFLSLLQIGHV